MTSNNHNLTPLDNNTVIRKKTGENSLYYGAERDNENDEKYTQLKKLYDERINSLYSNLLQIAKKFEGDEILKTMKNDSISNDYIHQRMKEIIDITLTKEKEELLKKMSDEVAFARTQTIERENFINEMKSNHQAIIEDYQMKVEHLESMCDKELVKNKQLENRIKLLQNEVENNDILNRKNSEELLNKRSKVVGELQRLKKDYDVAIDHIKKYDDIDKENECLRMEIERLKKVICVLEIDCQHTEEKLKEKQTKNEGLHEEITSIKNQVFDFNLNNKKLQEENKSLTSMIEKYENERKTITEKCNNMTLDIEKNMNCKVVSIEQIFKEKNFLLKKKILEQKNCISVITEEIKKEKENTEFIKLTFNTKNQQLKDDMMLIKNEWEKKCNELENYYENAIMDMEEKLKQQEINYEKLISDNQLKMNNDITELSNNYQSIIDDKQKEIEGLNNQIELKIMKEKDFISLSKHEEIIVLKEKELEKNHLQEINSKKQEYSNEYSNREIKKKFETDLEITLLNNKINQGEKQFEEIKNEKNELESKLNKEKENYKKMKESNDLLNKNNKFQNSQIEENEVVINNLREKVNVLEERLNMLSNSKNSFQDTIENLLNKIKSLENEKTDLKTNSLKKEEFYRHDHENLERVLRDYKESQNKNYNELLNQISIKENQINTIESSKRKLENNNVTLESKNREISNQNEILQQILNNMKLKIKNYEELIEELEQKSYYSEKNLKRTKFDKCNSNELLVKILKTKLKCMRDQIASTKNYFKEEINNFKIEIFRMAEDSMISQFNLMKINYERELQNLRVIIKKENQKIIEEKDSYNREEISKMTHKYELKIIDILKRNEVLDNEINKLKDEHYRYPTKLSSLEKENSRLQAIYNCLKTENESLINRIKNNEQFLITNDKLKIINNGSKQNSSKLIEIHDMIVKLKGKYIEEIRKLKTDIQNLNFQHEMEINNHTHNLKLSIQQLENAINEEKNEKENIQLNVSKDVEKLKNMYDSKVELLTKKISELKVENKEKIEKLSESSNFHIYYKNQIKKLQNQLDLKTEELNNFKNNFDQLLDLKTKKIQEQQKGLKVTNTSSSKSMTKIDEEIKILMKKINANTMDLPVNDS